MVLYGQQIFYFYPKNSTPEVSIQVNVLHTAVSERLHFFILPVFLFSFTILWLVFISPSMSTGQLKWVSHRIESSVTGYRNMITSTPKERRNRVAFILVRCLKRPPPTCLSSHNVTAPLQTTQHSLFLSLSHLITHSWQAKSLSMVRLHFEKNTNFTTTLHYHAFVKRRAEERRYRANEKESRGKCRHCFTGGN